jgi:hypothetical protein
MISACLLHPRLRTYGCDAAGPAAIALLAFLYAITSQDGNFTIPDALAECFRWRVERFAEARRVLVRWGYLEVVRRARRKSPAVYRWT